MLINNQDLHVEIIHVGSKLEQKTVGILQSIGFIVLNAKDKTDTDPANTIYTQFVLQNMRIDFALPNAKLAIEINGAYWHPKGDLLTFKQVESRERDINKKISLLRMGWSLLSLSEIELNNPRIPRMIEQFILEHLKV